MNALESSLTTTACISKKQKKSRLGGSRGERGLEVNYSALKARMLEICFSVVTFVCLTETVTPLSHMCHCHYSEALACFIEL